MASTSEGATARARAEMVREVADQGRLVHSGLGVSPLDRRVLEVMRQVPRHEFVPLGSRALAHENRALQIAHRQTISQPYIVALMTSLLGVSEGDVVLEIGTGSGYQAAVLASLVEHLYSVERIIRLADEARERLERLGYRNVDVVTGDGWQGLPEHAPYDGIIVTAAASEVPPALVEQLAAGGRLVVPVGRTGSQQDLIVVERSREGVISRRSIIPVAFVPMRHGLS